MNRTKCKEKCNYCFIPVCKICMLPKTRASWINTIPIQCLKIIYACSFDSILYWVVIVQRWRCLFRLLTRFSTRFLILQSWKKVLEHFVLTMVNCHPLSPIAMLRTTNSLPKCPNTVWWGKGNSVFIDSEKIQVGLRLRFILHIIFSEGYLVFHNFFLPIL